MILHHVWKPTRGIRRCVKVYGTAVDPDEERKRQAMAKTPIRKPHSGLVTSVKEHIPGDCQPKT